MDKLLYFEWSPPWHVGWRLSGEGCHLAPEVKQSGSEFKTVWDANLLKNYTLFQHQDLRLVWNSSINSSWQSSIFTSNHACNTSPSIQHPSLEHAKNKSKCHTLRSPGFHLVDHKVFSPHPLMSAWSGQVRVDIQLISWNAFCYSQLRRLTGSNLLTFFLTYLVTFFLLYLLTYLLAFFLTYLLTFFLTYLLQFFLTYVLTFFLTYLLTFFLTYLLTCFLTYLLTFFLTYPRQNIASTASHTSHSINSIFTSHHAANFVSVKRQFYSCIRLHQTAPPKSS